MRPFAIVVAMDEQYGIGKNGQLAWHLSVDLKHFKEVTTATLNPAKTNAVIMGRKTWESLPPKFRPLPGRLNIVLTREAGFVLPSGVLKAASLDEALSQIKPDIEGIFVIGGAQIYSQAIDHPACQKLYVTHLKGHFQCDAFFPAIHKQFVLISASEVQAEGKLNFHFCEYLKQV